MAELNHWFPAASDDFLASFGDSIGFVAQSAFASRVFGVAAAAALAYALFRIFEPFFGPILWAVLLAFLLHPLNVRLRKRMRERSGAAAGVLTLSVALGLAVPATVLVVAFAGQASDLAARVSAAATRYRIARPSDVFALPVLQDAFRWIEQHVPVTSDEVQAWLLEGSKKFLQRLAASSGAIFLGALGALANTVLMLFVLFFFLRDGDGMARRLVRVVPMPEAKKQRLVDHLGSVTKAVVFGTLLTAIIQGASVGIGFVLVRLPSPVVFGAIAAACSLLPVGGTAFVWLPGAMVLAAQGRWGAAIFLAAWGVLLVGVLDNVLRPLFISGRAEITTLPVFFGVLGGLAAFGPIGLFLGPLLLALALALLRFAEENQARSSQLTALSQAGAGEDPPQSES
jgi:predicted PurR-regulated permease PerM